jgi:hypothetical protein
MKTSIYRQQGAEAPCNSSQQNQSGTEVPLKYSTVGKGIYTLVETNVTYI